MILVDANVALYAYDKSNVRHKRARAWFEGALNGEERVAFSLLGLLAFLRISTSYGVFPKPLTSARAIAIVSSWLTRPNVAVATPTERHWELLAGLAETGQARGPLLMDAHLAALAIEHGATLFTTDRDFARFAGVRVRDPLEA